MDMPLLEYCNTNRQRDVVTAYYEQGCNKTQAGNHLGIKRESVRSVMKPVEQRAKHNIPDGMKLSGTSTLMKGDEKVMEWVKVSQDQERQNEIMEEAVKAMAEKLPTEPPVQKPRITNTDLASLYVITDYHLGMLSWHEESGADWDVQIAEDLLVEWFQSAIRMSPQSSTAIFAQLGDFMHWDGMEAVTPTSKHVLDADSRFQKIVRIAIRAIRRVIRLLLAKHQHVHIVMAEGNHDPASSVWLREWMNAIYEDEPRVTVDLSPDPYYCYEHGETSLFFHHGHKRKVGNIDDVFVAKYREVFGRTRNSYAHMGHLHSVDVKETNLMIVEQHRTLAAPDAYASRGGWSSGRDAKVITYSKRFGEVGRIVVSPDMVRNAA